MLSIHTYWQICLKKKTKHYNSREHLRGHTSSNINHYNMIIVRILVNTILLITWFETRVTRGVSHMDLEMPTLPEHLGSHPVFSGIRVARYIVFLCSVLLIIVCSFVLFILAIVVVCPFSIDFWLPLGIFKQFLPHIHAITILAYKISGNNDF